MEHLADPWIMFVGNIRVTSSERTFPADRTEWISTERQANVWLYRESLGKHRANKQTLWTQQPTLGISPFNSFRLHLKNKTQIS